MRRPIKSPSRTARRRSKSEYKRQPRLPASSQRHIQYLREQRVGTATFLSLGSLQVPSQELLERIGAKVAQDGRFRFAADVITSDDAIKRRFSEKTQAAHKLCAAIKCNCQFSFPRERPRRLLYNDTKSKDKITGRKFWNPFAASLDITPRSIDKSDPPKSPVTRLTKPIADIFPATTVMFAGILGFTAWRSVREPS
jgi:hypothetical protein